MKASKKPLLLAAAWFAAGCLSMTAMATEADSVKSTISVTGSASASVAPDLVSVAFGVEVQGDTAAAALATNSEFMAQVIEAVLETGVSEEEISTSQFNIYPVYDRHQDKATGVHTQVLTGYRVNNMVNVETGKLDRVAQIIDAAVDAGVNRVDRVTFGLSPGVRDRLKDDMIEAAVLDARSRAEKALTPLGHAITGVRQVSLADFAAPVPMYGEVARMDMARSAPTQVFAGDQEVKTTVNVIFLIGPD